MRIAVAQLTSGIDPAANAAVLEDAIAQAAQGGASMLFTPEMSGLLDRNRERARPHVVKEDDSLVLQQVRRAAEAHGIWVQLGSLPVQHEQDGARWANRAYLIDPAGRIAARYDKLHLFDVDLGDQSWRESSAYRAGDRAVVAETPLGLLGLSICYDVRFPALYAALSEGGASVLSVPSAFTVPTGRAHWHCLLRARAIENACWVIAAAQVGRHEDGRETFGHSLVIDPWGTVVLDMGDGAGVGFAEVHADRVAESRAKLPVLAHRRPIPQVTIR